ncbi:hypothetical protein GcM3_183062 [Golovinomyces cichoracearum]|uniref:Uncharacterized protein n=1 Tax=Golovinomyces cichoracearum TaxID=62708 RepID=A0A420HLC6_9PEZI|nr:hypothetical protein GcM3_183062 [Golovinomyces cichoracearum]
MGGECGKYVECQSAVNTTSNIEAQDWHARHLHSQSHGTCGTLQRLQGHCDWAAEARRDYAAWRPMAW